MLYAWSVSRPQQGSFFIPYFLVAQSTRLGAAIAVPPFVFEKNVILPSFLPVPPFLVFVGRSLNIKELLIMDKLRMIYENPATTTKNKKILAARAGTKQAETEKN